MHKYTVKGVMKLKSGDVVSFEEEFASPIRAATAQAKAIALGYTVTISTPSSLALGYTVTISTDE